MTQRDAQGHCRITTRILEDLRDSPEVCTLYQTPPLLTRTRRTAGRGCRQRSAASCNPEHLAPGRRRSAANLRRELFFTHELNAVRSLPSTACKALEERGGSPPALARPNRLDGASPPRPQATPPSPCSGPTGESAPAARYVPHHLLGQRMHGAGKHELLRRRRMSRAASSQMAAPGSFSSPSCCTEQTPTALRVQTRVRLTTARRAT